MGPRFTGLLLLVAVISILSVVCRLYLIEVRYREDPSIGLAIKDSPSLVSYQYDDEQVKVVEILLLDEHAYLGEDAYAFLVKGGWLIFPSLFLLLSLVWLWHRRGTSIRR
jgi:hypothetical protein